MWVADMDFVTAPEINEVLSERAARGAFGYGEVTDDWYDAYISWWRDRHGFTMDRNGLIFTTGVIPAISSTVRKLTSPNENVVIQTPVYNIFFNCILNNGARVSESHLTYKGGRYTMDLKDLEKKFADPQTTLMLLCNPHNPTGNIWDEETLGRIGEMADEYGVTVLSDEIHCDITTPGYSYVPFASVSETNAKVSVTAISPTKVFNLAGLQTAAVYVPDKALRHKIWRALNTDEVAEPNSFAVPAAVAAFNLGGAWCDELREKIEENRQRVAEFIKTEMPRLRLIDGYATYLLWIDVSGAGLSGADFAHRLRRRTGLFVSRGSIYGERAGRSFIRLNVACPTEILEDGLNRLKSFYDCL